jgi:hypothetical protein
VAIFASDVAGVEAIDFRCGGQRREVEVEEQRQILILNVEHSAVLGCLDIGGDLLDQACRKAERG